MSFPTYSFLSSSSGIHYGCSLNTMYIAPHAATPCESYQRTLLFVHSISGVAGKAGATISALASKMLFKKVGALWGLYHRCEYAFLFLVIRSFFLIQRERETVVRWTGAMFVSVLAAFTLLLKARGSGSATPTSETRERKMRSGGV